MRVWGRVGGGEEWGFRGRIEGGGGGKVEEEEVEVEEEEEEIYIF